MKKLVALLITASLCVSVSSCGLVKINPKGEIEEKKDEVLSAEEKVIGDENDENKVDEKAPNGMTEKSDGETESEEKPEPEPQVNPDLADTKTAKVENDTLSGNYYMELELTFKDAADKDSKMGCTYAVEEDNSYFRINTLNMDFSMIFTPEHLYTLDNSTKQYVEGVSETLSSLTSIVKRIRFGDVYENEASLVTGELEIDGAKYDYEMFSEGENKTSKYAYDKDDNLKYVIFTDNDVDTIVKISELTSKIPDGIFEIPSDFTLYEAHDPEEADEKQ